MFLQVIGSILFPPIIWFVYSYIKHLIECLYYPKGPVPLPFLGNTNLLRKKEVCIEFANLGKIYGDIYGFSIGSIRYVVVNNLEGINEVLIKKGSLFSGRPRILHWSRAMNGLINNDLNATFKVLRKITSSSLKIYAEGLVGMEKRAIDEYSHLNKKLLSLNGQAVSMKNMIELTILNIICTILFNQRYKQDDDEFHNIIKYSNLTVKAFGAGSLLSSIPWLRYFPTTASKYVQEIERLRDPILKRKIQEHRKSYDENNLRDITDALIKASFHLNAEKDSLVKVTDDNIEFILNDLILAGSETSSSTIIWFIIYILHSPEYQDKIFNEIIKVTSGNRYPCLNDRPLLHLLQATIHETLRLSSVVPLGLRHKAMENSTICDKPILKGTIIITNLWSIHHDERYWKNPMSFYPERWLNETGEFDYKLGNAFIPFSSGPRACLGETLAKTELFVIISRLVTDFYFEKSIEEDLPRLDSFPGVTRSPYDFKVVVVSRK
ncbi:steroid 17-alpha-hydroxylase/17,20 lyase isoform X2 [Hydra vulgaris]|uniref:Steroid 17-alpha-hydroxylase/17,20 lyase isoform X2 n=1 Tax=Hydra vulgaris TaxID=6087 RepID=A0ABM4BI60_HYDVU